MKTSNNKRYTATSAATTKPNTDRLTQAARKQVNRDFHRKVTRPAEEARWAAERAAKQAVRQNPAIHAHTALRVGRLIDYETDVEGEAEDVERLAEHNNDGALLVGGLLGVLVVVGAALVDAAAEKRKRRQVAA